MSPLRHSETPACSCSLGSFETLAGLQSRCHHQNSLRLRPHIAQAIKFQLRDGAGKVRAKKAAPANVASGRIKKPVFVLLRRRGGINLSANTRAVRGILDLSFAIPVSFIFYFSLRKKKRTVCVLRAKRRCRRRKTPGWSCYAQLAAPGDKTAGCLCHKQTPERKRSSHHQREEKGEEASNVE